MPGGCQRHDPRVQDDLEGASQMLGDGGHGGVSPPAHMPIRAVPEAAVPFLDGPGAAAILDERRES